MEKRRNIIKPIIKFNNKILFIGINPVEGSFKNNYYHYFSNNNYFYTLLQQSGFTTEKIVDYELENYNYGIMNYCNISAKTPKEIPKEEWEKDKIEFINVINKYTPDNIIFLGKFIPKLFFNLKDIEFGKKYQSINHICNDINFSFNWFVVPFPTSFMKKNIKLNYYKETYRQIK